MVKLICIFVIYINIFILQLSGGINRNLNYDNGLNAFVISLSCIIFEILHKVNIPIMVEAKLHIGHIYTSIYIHVTTV